ncbi:cytochrome c class I [Gluconacetobacter sacchari DSM 12717]|uniref:Cystathionine beta-lyase n=2 Tax=Gluconacetobacter sacchari TaxID=92759 RepID=A0A7W4NJQ8_9PROT|nr:cystathionine beta-lyase [Gluconacetobacter sacchari]MBB2159059.1 cystathionine beta-lyase [Gluconacetobacter sacchari]GBQ31610.1 cytochrome c class I [Gluconacetobacter sacchari DSM 12717]
MRRIRSPETRGRFVRLPWPVLAIVAVAGLMMPGRGAWALDQVRSTYLEKCGGCHGIEGRSGQTYIPTLRDRVGTLSCTPEGRTYLLTVPGVSMSLIRDDALMARVMNFVLFDLGGESTPTGTRPFTAAEIHAQRGHALSTTDLPALRGQVWARAIACAAGRR